MAMVAELGMVGDADTDAEVVAQPRTYSWRAPHWLPAALVIGAALWAGGIWWMVANLGSPDAPAVGAGALSDEVAVLRAKVDSLTEQTSVLGQERDALAKRIAALEVRPAVLAVATPAASPASTPPPAVVPMNLTATAGAYSIPRFAYLRAADPQVSPAPAPSVTTAPVFAAVVPTPAAVAAGAGATTRFFTNGVDKYNCTSFRSQAEAQEALAANAPGDPNRMDMNGNGVACDDITYPPNTPKNLTPVANR